VSVQLAIGTDRASVFCAYRLATATGGWSSTTTTAATPASASGPSAGVCCYEIPLPGRNPSAVLSAPSARHDLDGRYVSSQVLVDSAPSFPDAAAGAGVGGGSITVARPDGLYSYSRTERTGVAPIDGLKLAFCLVPSPVLGERPRHAPQASSSSSSNAYAYAYASSNGCLSLVASTDAKSNRDAIDIYDSLNKLVAFHLLLSPGHRAIRAAAVATAPTVTGDGSVRGGRSSAVVLTSGGALITLTEKLTQEKIALLVQKNLYSAAIVVAYADPSTDVSVITSLYRQYAEHLYRKGDFGGAIDQYCHTIGSLESSHVIFRYVALTKASAAAPRGSNSETQLSTLLQVSRRSQDPFARKIPREAPHSRSCYSSPQ
jgi:vacuolar protein sorting-associated protein 11